MKEILKGPPKLLDFAAFWHITSINCLQDTFAKMQPQKLAGCTPL